MREFTGMSVSRDVTGKTKEALSTMATTASYLFFCPELIKTVLRHPSPDSHLYFSLHPKLFFADSKGRDENKQIFAMCSNLLTLLFPLERCSGWQDPC